MGKLFGTDGIRGVANQYPITCEMALKTGRAMGVYTRRNNLQTVIIGRDTRISGKMLESALAAGVAASGCDVFLAGVIPTPGIAFLCTEIENAGAGVMISASHNPYEDNGIKIFKHGGIKLSDDEEESIENDILSNDLKKIPSDRVGRIISMDDSVQRYAQFLMNKFKYPLSEKKIKIVIDCSNGAASNIAPVVFNRKCFEPHFIHHHPDGMNINDNCGSQHTSSLCLQVKKNGADIGLAFDGDADRLIAVDETGKKITGDQIIAICAAFAKSRNQLKNSIVVSTIMSNVGLSETLSSLKIKHVKAGVGDRKVLEKMKKHDAMIGGEDSGHMIFLEEHSTGDGILSGLKLLEVLLTLNRPLSEMAAIMKVYPQILKNIPVDASRPDYLQNKTIADTITSIEKKLENKGRVLIRYSGTQPLLRVMVEGPDQQVIETYCDEICEVISKNL